MSGLAAVLAGKEPPGLYRWEAGFDVEDLAATLDVAGWSLAHLDGAYAQTKADALRAMGLALNFPDYYGQNLDALADCLTDLSSDTVLLWDDWAPLARDDERTFTALLHTLDSRTTDPIPVRPKLLVLLRGNGPDLDVPLLD